MFFGCVFFYDPDGPTVEVICSPNVNFTIVFEFLPCCHPTLVTFFKSSPFVLSSLIDRHFADSLYSPYTFLLPNTQLFIVSIFIIISN